jgi:hypothetical protein
MILMIPFKTIPIATISVLIMPIMTGVAPEQHWKR